MTSNQSSTNKKITRLRSLSLTRGFTVLFIPAIHTMMLYSQPTTQQSILGNILAFIAEMPGAQVFMLLMGLFFNYTKPKTGKAVLKKCLTLMLAAYGLNIFKFILPLLLHLLPIGLLTELGLKNDYHAIISLFILGDILHFAAIAYGLLYLVSRLPRYPLWVILLIPIIAICAPLGWDLHTGISPVDYLLVLLGGHPPNVYFPILPWIVYPLAGMSIGYFLKRYGQQQVFAKLFWLGLSMVIFTCLLPATSGKDAWLPFYRTNAADTFFHLGFILFWISLIYFLTRSIPDNYFFQLLKFGSRHITVIYIIQWLLICGCLPITGYQTLNFFDTLLWMLGTSLVTLFLTMMYAVAHARPKNL